MTTDSVVIANLWSKHECWQKEHVLKCRICKNYHSNAWREMIKLAFTWEAIYILLLFIQIYDKVTSANKVIMIQEANLFGTIFFTMPWDNIYSLHVQLPPWGEMPWGIPSARRENHFRFNCHCHWCGKRVHLCVIITKKLHEIPYHTVAHWN